MRRALAVILFVLGGWILSSEAMVAWINVGQGTASGIFMLAFFVAFAAVPLLLGTWASPGNRLAELGLTLMIGAGVGGAIVLMLLTITNDPGFKKVWPPDQPMPDFHFNPVLGMINLLAIAGAGYALRRWARDRARQENPDLTQVFD